MPIFFVIIESILSQISKPFKEGRAKGLLFSNNNIPVRGQSAVLRHQITAQVCVVNIELQHRASLCAANSTQAVFVAKSLEAGKIVIGSEFCATAVEQVIEMGSFAVVIKFCSGNGASGPSAVQQEGMGGR